MRTICSREIFTKKCRQQQNFDSDPKEAWHFNHVTFTSIAKNFMLFCRLIHMLSTLYVGLKIKVKVGIPESFKVEWYPHKITGSSHLNFEQFTNPTAKKSTFSSVVLSVWGFALVLNITAIKLIRKIEHRPRLKERQSREERNKPRLDGS